MRSAYPSSQSFFDSTSDSIRAEDIDKCRTSSSFSSLVDLFSNPATKSALFPHVRVPVFDPEEEVHFPAKKKRECVEVTSIWHEWGSGECQTENVADESSGLVLDLPKSGCTEFPNLGSANITILPPEFSFPERKSREEGSSWREDRTCRQDWNMNSGSSTGGSTASTTPVGSITDLQSSKLSSRPSTLIASSKPSVFSSSASDELTFPARKKREERSFWQECSLADVSTCEERKPAAPKERKSGVGALADLYTNKPGSKCSSLFSSSSLNSSEEVIFPQRKYRPDRNEWRDWRNSGYTDSDDDEDSYEAGHQTCNSSPPMSSDGEVAACSPSHHSSTVVGCASIAGVVSSSKSHPAAFTSVAADQGISADFAACMAAAKPSSEIEASEAIACGTGGKLSNADESISSDFSSTKASDAEQLRQTFCRTADGAESHFVSSEFDHDAYSDIRPMSRIRNGPKEHYDQRNSRYSGKYPPSLARQGSSHVNHMPWVQLQPIRSEGRFVLQEVKVTQPVVFQPIRKEGRLVLQLIGHSVQSHKGKMFNSSYRREEEVCPALEKVPVKTVVVESVVSGSDLGGEKLSKSQGNEVAEKFSSEENVHSAITLVKSDAKDVRVNEVHVDENLGKWSFLLKSPKFPQIWPEIEEYPKLESPRDVETEPSVSATGGNSAELWGSKVSIYDGRDLILEKPYRVARDVAAPEDKQGRMKILLLSHGLSPHSDGLAVNGNITFHSERNVDPANSRLSRARSMRNSNIPGLATPRKEGEVSLTRSKSIRSSSVTDFAGAGCAREERLHGGMTFDGRPFHCIGRGFREGCALSLTTAHSFFRSLRTRPDVPGESDSRLNYTPGVTASFSCADGVGKRHHEKSFWEQQPCVS